MFEWIFKTWTSTNQIDLAIFVLQTIQADLNSLILGTSPVYSDLKKALNFLYKQY